MNDFIQYNEGKHDMFFQVKATSNKYARIIFNRKYKDMYVIDSIYLASSVKGFLPKNKYYTVECHKRRR
jgi:hypothetical protein